MYCQFCAVSWVHSRKKKHIDLIINYVQKCFCKDDYIFNVSNVSNCLFMNSISIARGKWIKMISHFLLDSKYFLRFLSYPLFCIKHYTLMYLLKQTYD